MAACSPENANGHDLLNMGLSSPYLCAETLGFRCNRKNQKGSDVIPMVRPHPMPEDGWVQGYPRVFVEATPDPQYSASKMGFKTGPQSIEKGIEAV